MSSDLFPIYCRQCHRQISASARVCPHCSAPQGLSTQAATPGPPTAAAAPPADGGYAPAPQQNQPAAAAPQGASTCFACLTQITPGDIFCRACGRALVPGMRAPGDASEAAAKAYGISAIVCALLGFGPGGIVLGVIALAKGARGLGCAGVVLGAVGTALALMVGAGLVQQLLQGLPAGLGIPKDLLP